MTYDKNGKRSHLIMKGRKTVNEEYETEKKNGRKWLILLILLVLLVLLIVLLAGAALGVFLVRNEEQDEEHPDGGVGLVLDPDAGEASAGESRNAKGQDVVISGKGALLFPVHEKEVSVDFYNPKENAGRYYLTFELRIPDQSGNGYEVLYASGLVEAGKHINRITLSRGLEKGVYEAVIHVQPYCMDQERTLTNNADMKTVLLVE